MKRPILILAFLAGTLLALPQLAVSARGAFGSGAHIAAAIMRVADELELTDAQREEIRGLMSDQREELEPLIAELKSNRQALLAASQPGSVDADAITLLAQAQSELLETLIIEHAYFRADVLAVLTEEQREELAEIRQRFREFREARRDAFGRGS